MARQFLTPVVLPADPVAPMEASTKQYVDALAGGTGEVYVGDDDPRVTDPASTVELWFQPVVVPLPPIGAVPDPATIGQTVTITFTTGVPGQTYTAYDLGSSGAYGNISPPTPPAQVADANGVCVWTTSWAQCPASKTNEVGVYGTTENVYVANIQLGCL